MQLQQRIKAFVQLGKVLKAIGSRGPWPGFEIGVGQTEYESLERQVQQAQIHNKWFTEENVRKAMKAWGEQLTAENLEKWLEDYSTDFEQPIDKTVGIVMAGNIPLVGFHDLLTVLISGAKAKVKMSSDDTVLMQQVIETVILIEPDFKDRVELAPDRLKGIDAVMATGSNNTARYFEYYFSEMPNIIRKNRNSVAVLTGDESAEELHQLGTDIFAYYGLGCRNVSKIYLPESYDLDAFFKGIFEYKDVIDHNKYGNNYDYNKTIWLMNKETIYDNGFLLLKEEKSLSSPLATVYYERYNDIDDVKTELENRSEELQCVVGKDFLPFGEAQQPALWDYADGVNTLDFMKSLR
ncbi:acyl-CoA reductase [Halocola ammonii]